MATIPLNWTRVKDLNAGDIISTPDADHFEIGYICRPKPGYVNLVSKKTTQVLQYRPNYQVILH